MKNPKFILESSVISDGNMSFFRGNPDEALQNRLNFFKKLNLDSKNVITFSPAHTNIIKIVTEDDKGQTFADTDGLVITDPSIFLFTLTGDCIPLGITDKNK